jgi:hypothetical protein
VQDTNVNWKEKKKNTEKRRERITTRGMGMPVKKSKD